MNEPPPYVSRRQVVIVWIEHFITLHPGERPGLKWLAAKAKLPVPTVASYRRQYYYRFDNNGPKPRP